MEGLATVVVSAAGYLFVYNYPTTAEFLSDSERKFIEDRLRKDNDSTREEAFSWYAALDAFKDVKVWLYGLGFHTLSLPLYTLSLFMVSGWDTRYYIVSQADLTDMIQPTIIKQLGYTAAQAQLLTVPPYAVAFILTIVVAVISERTRLRAPFIIGSSAVACIGYIILLAQVSSRPGVAYLGTFFAAGGIYPAVAIVLSWPANNVSGQTKRCIANAMQISIGNLGAVIGTQLYRTETSPRYFLGHGFALGYLVANICVVAVTLWVLKRENAAKEAERESRGLKHWNVSNSGSEEAFPVGELQDFAGDKDPRWVLQT